MKAVMLGLIAETAIHCGAGRSSGVIDLPVAREAATDYPFIPGSGLKGSLRDRARERKWLNGGLDRVFGKPDSAGRLLFSDVRLMLLPVRSLTGAYRWLTCPLLLERYRRDLTRCGIGATLTIPPIAGGDGMPGVLTEGANNERLLLEEREFAITGACPPEVVEGIKSLIRHPEARERLAHQLAIVNDDDFAWFCRNALPIQARNGLNNKTKQSEKLWYEESLPPDTVLYAMVIPRDDETAVIRELFPDADPYLQIGGNETVGHGWVAVSILGGNRE
ncbi:MAG: type III-B CRISPR module RAMP protein Cmr4 [Candidatus Binataceae bacterium]